MAMQHKRKKIVKATMEFEADHEECVRVLPYTEGDQVVIQIYVFSDESGIPKHLKSAAKKCFGKMEVKYKWLDLYNDAADILKVTPVEYPSGERNRLNVSQIDAINEIISGNLHVLDHHRNVTSVQASFKITASKQTKSPCITIYVLGKGLIPIGESEFPRTLGPYPVDVVDGFWFRTSDPWTPNEAQEQSEVLCLGASIGVQGEEASGTLGAIVEDGGTLYALSCNHVMKHSVNSSIVHPGLNDHLNYLKYHLQEYGKRIKGITERGSFGIEFSVCSLKESNELSEKFEQIKLMKEKHLNSERCTQRNRKHIEMHEKAFERGLSPPRVIGKYIAGVSRNVSGTDGKEYFIDVAIAKLTDEEVNSLRQSRTAEIIGTGDIPSGECSLTTTKAIMSAKELCKSGRTTGYTTSDRLIGASLDPPHFMKQPMSFKINGGPLFDIFIQSYLNEGDEKSPPNQAEMKGILEPAPCEGLWCQNCLCIGSKRGHGKFVDLGDSGAVIFETESMLGFGVIFAAHENAYLSYAIASPLKVALEALSKQISEGSNLRLISSYV